jgi:hypothetical protein
MDIKGETFLLHWFRPHTGTAMCLVYVRHMPIPGTVDSVREEVESFTDHYTGRPMLDPGGPGWQLFAVEAAA